MVLESARMRRNPLTINRHHLIVGAVCLTCCVISAGGPVSAIMVGRAAAAAAPAELTDQQFWDLSRDSSEVDGEFRSDNLLSNETSFQRVIPGLLKTAKQGRVYLGVGPEQNFTYIAALKPAMAIIIDIRHGNLDVHLMYKALFELSNDRSEFVSRLFSRKRLSGLTAKSTAREIFSAYGTAEGSKEIYEDNLKAIEDVLMKQHGFPLTSGDLDGIRWALGNYYQFGPSINYNSSLSANVPPAIVGATGGNRGGNNGTTYADLMLADDGSGHNWSFLASEENFAFVKDLEARNLVVPVVGDFGGDKAIRAVARYLKSVDAMVSAFYVSNVEQFLTQGGIYDTFCASTLTLPLDETSIFIRSGPGGAYSTGGYPGGSVETSWTGNILSELSHCSTTRR